MEKERSYCIAIQSAFTGLVTWISGRLGILFPMIVIFVAMMVIDFISGYMASMKEAIEHPEDPNYGWSSKKGRLGIYKKVGYMCAVAVGMMVDVLIHTYGEYLGFDMKNVAIFSLLVLSWYILNEALSIIENVGRMGAPVPDWLKRYIAVLKNKVDKKAGGSENE